MTICANHPNQPARYQCVGCGRLLCSHCVVPDSVFQTNRCISCQGPVTELAEASIPMEPEPPGPGATAPPPGAAPWPQQGGPAPQPPPQQYQQPPPQGYPQPPPQGYQQPPPQGYPQPPPQGHQPPPQGYQQPPPQQVHQTPPQAMPPGTAAPTPAPPASDAPPGLMMDESSMAEAQYDPSRETSTSIEALSASTLNRYASGMEDDGVNLSGEPEQDLNAPLKHALEEGDDDAALQSYQSLTTQGETPKLESQLEAKLARVLDSAGMSQEAVQACRRIVMSDPDSPMAPGALFTGARLAAGRLGDQQMASRLLQFLIEKYPDSNLVPQAQDALKNIARQIQRRG